MPSYSSCECRKLRLVKEKGRFVFADPKRVAWRPDRLVTIDGLFNRYRGEDSSARVGVLTLVTRLAPVRTPVP
jgi:hypothetical protein